MKEAQVQGLIRQGKIYGCGYLWQFDGASHQQNVEALTFSINRM